MAQARKEVTQGVYTRAYSQPNSRIYSAVFWAAEQSHRRGLGVCEGLRVICNDKLAYEVTRVYVTNYSAWGCKSASVEGQRNHCIRH